MTATRRRRCAAPTTQWMRPFMLVGSIALLLALVAEAGDFGGHIGAAFAPRRFRHPAAAVSLFLGNDGLESTTATATTTKECSWNVPRGGASTVVEEEGESEDESESEEEEEEEETKQHAMNDDEDEEEESDDEEEAESLDPKLTAAAMKSSIKTKAKLQAQKASKLKETVSAKLMANKKPTVLKSAATATASSSVEPKKKKGGGFFKLPYIVKACLNPFTAWAMTRAYWASLFQLDYPPKDASQDLRSSLEEKGRTGGNTFQSKPKRKMKRGQAKTLSDLPQLST